VLKFIIIVLVISALGVPRLFGSVITLWDFNSSPPDTATSTGTIETRYGAGSVILVGGTTSTFEAGSSRDPRTNDNSALNVRNYASQGTSNKLRGVQFNVGTAGFRNITVSWEQRVSNTGSRYTRFQYTTNGVDFVDHEVITFLVGSQYQSQTNDLSAIPGVSDNPNFAIRLVAEWESSATTNANANYVAAGAINSTYGTTGLIRFDLFTVYGNPIPGGNTAPTISPLANQTGRGDTATSPAPFTIGDGETPVDDLILTATSSNPMLVDSDGVFFEGSGSNRTVAVMPKPGQLGTALITVTVTDGQSASASRAFQLTVLPQNTSPTISPIAHQHTIINVPADPIPFSVGDLESDPDALSVRVNSANLVLLPNDQISVTGTGANRILHLTPAQNQTGVAAITVQVSDGILTSNVVFAITVVPSPSVLLFEPFSYADGSVVENSGHFWSSSSGAAGETQVAGNWLEVSSVNTEDISAPLIGAPYTNSATVLYAKFDVIVRSFPTTDYGNYFAHFKGVGNSNFRGRVFATTLNAGPNTCRFAIGNSTTNFAQLETDLTTGVQYTVVIKYELDSGQSTLWLDPVSESAPSVTATDTLSPATIGGFAFRQAIGAGILNIKNLVVGTSFASVVQQEEFSLRIFRDENGLRAAWPLSAASAGFKLERSIQLNPTDWQPVNDTSFTVDDEKVIDLEGVGGAGFYRLRK